MNEDEVIEQEREGDGEKERERGRGKTSEGDRRLGRKSREPDSHPAPTNL